MPRSPAPTRPARAAAPRGRRDQRYCLDCGLMLPEVAGTVAGLRRRWLRRLGWYPGRLGLAVAADAARRGSRCGRGDRDQRAASGAGHRRSRLTDARRLPVRRAGRPVDRRTAPATRGQAADGTRAGSRQHPDGCAWPATRTAGRSSSSPIRRRPAARPRSRHGDAGREGAASRRSGSSIRAVRQPAAGLLRRLSADLRLEDRCRRGRRDGARQVRRRLRQIRADAVQPAAAGCTLTRSFAFGLKTFVTAPETV